jgi:hypothetical protein
MFFPKKFYNIFRYDAPLIVAFTKSAGPQFLILQYHTIFSPLVNLLHNRLSRVGFPCTKGHSFVYLPLMWKADSSERNSLSLCSTFSMINFTEQSPSREANNHSVKKFPAFYGNWNFITVIRSSRHWPRSWATCIVPPYFLKINFNIILPSTPVFRLVSSLPVFRPKFRMHFSSLPWFAFRAKCVHSPRS